MAADSCHYTRESSIKIDLMIPGTNIPGIFAAEDVRHGSIKRIAAGVGEGSTAIQLIHQYLSRV